MRIESQGMVASASASFESSEDRKSGLKVCEEEEEEEKGCSTDSSCSTSSIGRDSDVSSERSTGEEDCGENQAESAYNGPFHTMESLEEVLPIRRGISKFYNGKSKSFTSLADATSSPSIKDIAKPENAYTRRRRNLMAFNHVWDKNRNFPLRSNSGGISKRTISSSRSALALAVAMNNSDSNGSSNTSLDSMTSSPNSTSPPHLPPLHPQSRLTAGAASTWRSFSLADLQHCAIAATINMPQASTSEMKQLIDYSKLS